jgi:hypothetical protein
MYFKKFPKFLYDFDITKTVGSGTQATATAYVSGGAVTGVVIDNPGSGYVNATVTFSAPDTGFQGNTAAATGYAIIESGSISDIVVTTTGYGYDTTPLITISSPYTSQKTSTKAILMTDITRNIRFRRDVLANVTVYDYYDIIDGETPEIIAEKIYGNAEYHWVIMLVNERYDYLNDFPLTYPMLEQFITDKYGSEADSVHHYEDASGNVVMSTYPSATPITNRQYEEAKNEDKRRIKIISKNLISTILKNYKDEL